MKNPTDQRLHLKKQKEERKTDFVEELPDLLNTFFPTHSSFTRHPKFLHLLTNQTASVPDQRSLLPLALVVLRGELASSGETLDGREAFNFILGAQRLILIVVAVDGVEGDQRVEGARGLLELGCERFTVATPGSVEDDHRWTLFVRVCVWVYVSFVRGGGWERKDGGKQTYILSKNFLGKVMDTEFDDWLGECAGQGGRGECCG